MAWINKPKKKTEYHKTGRNITASSIYNTKQWKKLRIYYISEHPLCELCLADNIVKPSEEVHHIKPILKGKDELEMKDIAYDYNNLIALCTECHHKIHQELNSNRHTLQNKIDTIKDNKVE